MKRWIIALLIVVGMSITPSGWDESGDPDCSKDMSAKGLCSTR